MFRVTKTLEIAGAHKLNLTYDSKCKNLHGHNWKIKVTCECKDDELDQGMVLDFTSIKKAIVDKFDHMYLNDIKPFNKINPTAENMAKYICDAIPNCVYVSVQESEGNVAEYFKEVNSDDCK